MFTSSTLGLIVVGSQILYDQPPYLRVLADPTSGLLDSSVVLDAGDGNRAVGRCTLDFQTLLGLCTFSGRDRNVHRFRSPSRGRPYSQRLPLHLGWDVRVPSKASPIEGSTHSPRHRDVTFWAIGF